MSGFVLLPIIYIVNGMGRQNAERLRVAGKKRWLFVVNGASIGRIYPLVI